jgi:hypothetical protein
VLHQWGSLSGYGIAVCDAVAMAQYTPLAASGFSAAWSNPDGSHTSSIDLAWENEGWTANGTLGEDSAQFVIRMSALWVVQQFILFRDLEEPDLWLATDGHGRWGEMNGAHRTELDGCIDIDLKSTPFTNVIPIRRLPLHVGHSASQSVITVDIETLGVTVVPQVYSRLDTHTWSYISLTTGEQVEVSVDQFGFVLDEPGSFVRQPLP